MTNTAVAAIFTTLAVAFGYAATSPTAYHQVTGGPPPASMAAFQQEAALMVGLLALYVLLAGVTCWVELYVARARVRYLEGGDAA